MAPTLLLHIVLLSMMVILNSIAFIVAWRKQKGWLKLHRAGMLPGTLLGFGGILVLFVAKQIGTETHFGPLHAKIGLIATALLALPLLLGYNFTRLPAPLRPAHRISGRLAMAGAALALLSGIALLLG
jgi:hypothetical protein